MLLFISCISISSYASDKLEVHFIDVGQADSILIQCNDKNMLIDGGKPEDSSLIYAYLRDHGVSSLEYIVNTHGDSDHVGGLPAALQYVKGNVGTVLAPYKTSDKERFQVFTKKLSQYGKEITVPKAGDVYTLGDSTFQILSAGGTGDNESIVLRLVYGNTSFMFTGDASEDQEKSIVHSGYTIESDVLKVGHHGSKSSTCYQFLKGVYPSIAVISVGSDNSYGHPTEETLSRIRDEGATVLRTDTNGHIIISSDGKRITYSTQKDASQEQNLIPGGASTSLVKEAPSGSAQEYVLNTNSKKFHYPSCKSVNAMKDKNKKVTTDTRENILSQGYSPCGNCHP